jgi:hypothetical protein
MTVLLIAKVSSLNFRAIVTAQIVCTVRMGLAICSEFESCLPRRYYCCGNSRNWTAELCNRVEYSPLHFTEASWLDRYNLLTCSFKSEKLMLGALLSHSLFACGLS